ncbi:MAG: hypothetical protein AAF798_13690 [Bacteroidota bacterium]
MRLQASALFYALLMATLIAVLSVGLIALAQHFQALQQQQLRQLELVRNIYSGMAFWGQDEIDEIQLEEEQLFVAKQAWGLFQIGRVKAEQTFSFGTRSLQKAAILGEKVDKSSYTALYVQDNRKPVVLCGNTRIKGDVYRPKSGIKKGAVDGQAFSGTQLFIGKDRISENRMPALDTVLIEQLLALQKQKANQKLTDLAQELEHSFQEPLLVVQQKHLRLRKRALKGHILLLATDSITVEASAQLEDVILLAPFIRLKSGLKGSFQAYATEQMVVEERAILSYPSCIGLIKHRADQRQGYLELQSGVRIGGQVFSCLLPTSRGFPVIRIEANSMVEGSIFSDGPLQMEGKVHGNLYTRNFVLRKGGRNYYNYILNTVIDRTQLSKAYTGPFLKDRKAEYGIVKWVD